MEGVDIKISNTARFIGISFAVSIIIHIMLLFFIYKYPFASGSIDQNQEEAVDVKIMSPQSSQDLLNKMGGQIVDLMDNFESKETVKDSPYLSDKNRRVEREMQAPLTGPNPNAPFTSMGGGERKDILSFEESKEYDRGEERNNNGSARIVEGKKEDSRSKDKLNELNINPSQEELSRYFAQAPSNYLPNMQIGNATLLNTREFAYASFYIRMKRMMESIWDPRSILTRSAVERRPMYVTSLNIILNSDGSLASVSLDKSSGISALDREALRTVRESAPFPNPPKEILGPDRRIHIPSWNFIITYGRGGL